MDDYQSSGGKAHQPPLHAIRLDHDVSPLGFEAAGEDLELGGRAGHAQALLRNLGAGNAGGHTGRERDLGGRASAAGHAHGGA
eukprot:8686334-Pyramimonas_sp.AAC.1